MISSSRSLRVVQLSVAAGIVILLASVYALRASASQAFAQEVRLRAVRTLSENVLQAQIDEETGIRGFQVARRRVFLQPYDEARPTIAAHLGTLARALAAEGLPADEAARALALNARWQREVAVPAIAGTADDASVLTVGKAIVDAFRAELAGVQTELDARQVAVDAERRAALDRIGVVSSLVVIALGGFLFFFLRRQTVLEARVAAQRAIADSARLRAIELRAAYEAEKRIADSLQDAIAQRPLPLHPTLRFSATYVPATDETRVGGDWYDAIELPNNRVLFAIGDVTGHGLEAAVTMSRARQALVTSALFDPEPANVLARVNDDLVGQNAPMVTAVAGFADARTYEFVYASAGHPPPILLEPNRPPRLLAFGGVPLGVVGAARYEIHRVQSVPGAMLVLYTDGAVEHTRDVIEGESLLLASISRLNETTIDDAARQIHEGIFHGHPAGDDVAILTIGFGESQAGSLRISADDAQTSTVSRISRDGASGVVAEPPASRTALPAAWRRAS